MKKTLITVFIICVLLASCSRESVDYSFLNTDEIVNDIVENASVEFGYCDVSEYYLQNYFGELVGVEEAKIYACNESSNFNEFGVFKFATAKEAEKGLRFLDSYITAAKKEFENGIIYDVSEYPKFTGARAERFGNYLIYTILDPRESQSAFEAVKKTENK